VISGKKKNNYDSENDEDEDLRNSDYEEDQEEYYRQYLKRCQLKEKGDDEMTYLYNLKPARYYQFIRYRHTIIGKPLIKNRK
jgi:hypothetical protein